MEEITRRFINDIQHHIDAADKQKNTIHATALNIVQVQLEQALVGQKQVDDALHALETKYSNLLLTNTMLSQTLSKLEEELHNFKKVSQIIAYEKENSRLRKEIELLKEIMSKPPLLFLPPLPLLDDGAKAYSETETEAEIELIEVVIKNKHYYMTDDQDKQIYAQLPDGEIGDKLGHMDKNGRPVWD